MHYRVLGSRGFLSGFYRGLGFRGFLFGFSRGALDSGMIFLGAEEAQSFGFRVVLNLPGPSLCPQIGVMAPNHGHVGSNRG